jgi:secondary thiamine-phosphate synthase enzyme
MTSYSLQTDKQGMYDITPQVREAIRKIGTGSGLCVVYCSHTTAAVTINENADPDVIRDLLFGLDKTFPDRLEFRHSEGNSAAHLKSSCIGASVTLIVENGEPVLGTWQAVYFCEFDGPRRRTFHVKVVQG